MTLIFTKERKIPRAGGRPGRGVSAAILVGIARPPVGWASAARPTAPGRFAVGRAALAHPTRHWHVRIDYLAGVPQSGRAGASGPASGRAAYFGGSAWSGSISLRRASSGPPP